MKGNLRLTILFFLLSSAAVFAQTNFYLDGTGRVITKHDKITGETIEEQALAAPYTPADTTNVPNKGLSGYQLFDLGLHLERGKSFHAVTIMRARNQFGYFYGQGVDITFRQISIEGVIGKGVKYELGDIDVELTPYTLHNFGQPMTDYESDIFKERREILEYENFVDGNSWRLQGVNMFSTLLFEKGIEKLYVQGLATRTQPYNGIGKNDRLLFGATLQAKQSEYLDFGFNYAGISDVTISTSDSTYRNNVFTGNFDVHNDFDTPVMFGLVGELGASNRYIKNEKNTTIPSEKLNGSFFDVALKAEHKESGIKFLGGFRNVDDNFRSPGAQTRRYNDYSSQDRLFEQVPTYSSSDDTYYINGSRNQLMYDRYTEEKVYNRNLTMVNLGNYNPIYGNMHRYGVATNNRSGFYIKLDREGENKAYNFKLTFDSHQEIEPFETDGEKRNFMAYGAGLRFNFHEILEWKKDLTLTGSYSAENTDRSASTAGSEVDLKTNVLDIGASIEVIENISLVYGYKAFAAKGNEFIATQDNAAELPFMVDSKENVQSFGLVFKLSPKSFISGYWNIVDYKNNFDTTTGGVPTAPYNDAANTVTPSYKINELFLNFTLRF